MRFLVDECTGSRVSGWLRAENHEVFSVFDEARGMNDDEVLAKAFAENWILITNDSDFGEMIFRERRPHHGSFFFGWIMSDGQTKLKFYSGCWKVTPNACRKNLL